MNDSDPVDFRRIHISDGLHVSPKRAPLWRAVWREVALTVLVAAFLVGAFIWWVAR